MYYNQITTLLLLSIYFVYKNRALHITIFYKKKIMNAKYYNFYKEIIEILEENNNKIHCTLCGNEIVGMRTRPKAESLVTLM